MYENNENELEIYFTAEDLKLQSSSRNTNLDSTVALTKMEQNLSPNYLPHGLETDDLLEEWRICFKTEISQLIQC